MGLYLGSHCSVGTCSSCGILAHVWNDQCLVWNLVFLLQHHSLELWGSLACQLQHLQQVLHTSSYIFISYLVTDGLRGPWLLTKLSQGVAELLQVAPWLDGQFLCNRFLSYHWLMFLGCLCLHDIILFEIIVMLLSYLHTLSCRQRYWLGDVATRICWLTCRRMTSEDRYMQSDESADEESDLDEVLLDGPGWVLVRAFNGK